MRSRIVHEAIKIKRHRNFNREDGHRLSLRWNPVIGKRKCHRDNSVRQCEDVVNVVSRNTDGIIQLLTVIKCG